MTTALVTGTSSGIGLATAVALARGGHTVAATMRNLDGGGELRKIAAAEKLPIHLAVLNVNDDASVREAFAKVIAEHGPIDILVNNAGISGGDAIEETQGRRSEGHALLKPVLESFEEGQNTSDFLESRRLLDELAHSKA